MQEDIQSLEVAYDVSPGVAVAVSRRADSVAAPLDRICRSAIRADIEAIDAGPAAVRAFAQRVREDLAEQVRAGTVQEDEQALLEEIGRTLNVDLLARHKASPASGASLAKVLLDELDWRYPSRYVAARHLRELAKQAGRPSPLRQPDLSKLERTGRGVSAERIAETLSLLDLTVVVRPNSFRPRLHFRRDQQAASGDSLRRTSALGGLDYSRLTRRLSVDKEPLGLFVCPTAEGRIERVVPISPWADIHGESSAWRKAIADCRATLATKAENRDVRVESIAGRGQLSDSAAIAPGTAILVSLLDLGAPILNGAECLLVRVPDSASDGTPFVHPGNEGSLGLAARFEACVRRLQRLSPPYPQTVLGLLTAHAGAAEWLASPTSGVSTIPGPTLRNVPLGGLETAWLILHLVDRLVVSTTQKESAEPSRTTALSFNDHFTRAPIQNVPDADHWSVTLGGDAGSIVLDLPSTFQKHLGVGEVVEALTHKDISRKGTRVISIVLFSHKAVIEALNEQPVSDRFWKCEIDESRRPINWRTLTPEETTQLARSYVSYEVYRTPLSESQSTTTSLFFEWPADLVGYYCDQLRIGGAATSSDPVPARRPALRPTAA